MEGDPPARLVLTDEPYNVPIAGHVSGGDHREFTMASGEMTDAEFLGFNVAWIDAASRHLCDGGVFGTYIDWRGVANRSRGGWAARPRAPQPHRLGQDQRRHGQPLSLAA